MKATAVRGMPVVSVSGAKKLGAVQDIVLNPSEGRVVAIRVKLAPEGIVKTLSGPDVKIGRDAVTVQDAKSVPEEDLTGVEGTVDLIRLLGKRVLTEGGDLLGTVEDVEIDGSHLSIKGYDISKGPLPGLFGGKTTLPAAKGIHYGRDILMVPDEAVPKEKGRKAA